MDSTKSHLHRFGGGDDVVRIIDTGITATISIQASASRVGPFTEVRTLDLPAAEVDRINKVLREDNEPDEAARLRFSWIEPSPEARPRVAAVDTWLDRASFFIPRSIREPFLGDLREDLDDMRCSGYRPSALWWASVCQVACALGNALLAIWRR